MFAFDKKLTFLAPLAGYTDSAFRRVCRNTGADVVITEMVNAIGLSLSKSQRKAGGYIRYLPSEKPIGLQLFGRDPDITAHAAANGEKLGFDFVDINMGCPVKKVLKTGSGESLLRDKKLAYSIVREIRNTIKIPLSVKIRTGWDEGDNSYMEFAEIMASGGADVISVHPRTVMQGMKGEPDHKKTSDIRKNLKEIYIIANGGIESVEDAFMVYESTGCDGIMIGRGALRNPLIFLHIKNLMGEENCKGSLSLGDIVMEHFTNLHSHYGKRAPVLFRKYITWYTKELPNSSRFRNRISQITDPEVIRFEVEKFFSETY